MDTEEGVEVVWNEVLFSEKRSWKNKEVRIIFFFTCKPFFFVMLCYTLYSKVAYKQKWVPLSYPKHQIIITLEFKPQRSKQTVSYVFEMSDALKPGVNMIHDTLV